MTVETATLLPVLFHPTLNDHSRLLLVNTYFSTSHFAHPAAHYTYSLNPLHISPAPCYPAAQSKTAQCHTACPATLQCFTPAGVRPTVSKAAQGYRIGLPSAVHASPAGATKNEKCQFWALYP